MSSSPKSQLPVLVTGGNGFVGTYVVKELLDSGYRVRATVRDPSNDVKVGHLRSLQNAEGNLELVRADLTDAECWDEVMKGCDFVMHTASPYKLNVKHPMEELIIPAVQGTENVVKAAIRAKIKKVIMTSTMGAVVGIAKNNYTYTPEDWNEDCSEKMVPYMYSKTIAEKKARDLVFGSDTAFATIHPGAVLGEEIGSSVNTTTSMLKDIMNGKIPFAFDQKLFASHVEDVALAHVRAMENDEAEGRFFVTEDKTPNLVDYFKILAEEYPLCKIPTHTAGFFPHLLAKSMKFFLPADEAFFLSYCHKNYEVDNSRTKEILGLEFGNFKRGVLGTAKSLVKKGLIHKYPAPQPEE